jgi:hypothetical protein
MNPKRGRDSPRRDSMVMRSIPTSELEQNDESMFIFSVHMFH